MLPTLLHDLSFSLTVSQQGIHTRGFSSPGLAGSPQPWCGGLQSPNRIVVTPTFYKNKIFVHIGVHIKCISNYSTYEKLSKNKSCIGCIAWHGILYFSKILSSLEEFRKNPHVKIPPKSPSTNCQSLGKFKNPILIQKFPFS
jgi:hypothetical protein